MKDRNAIAKRNAAKKQRNNAKRKAKRSAAALERRETAAAQRWINKLVRQFNATRQQYQPVMDEEEHSFWIAHGINYLVSDETTGVWDPMFQAIYEDGDVSYDDIGAALSERYKAEMEMNPMPPLTQTVLSWAVLDDRVVAMYVNEMVRRIMEANEGWTKEQALEDARRPHHPTVWDVMRLVKERVSHTVSERSEDETSDVTDSPS